ncbi:MAG: NUDIX domain-containing protein [Candidatus Diapherotrites archaeon]
MEEILDLIDEENNVIGKASRKEIKEKGLLYRCAGVYVMHNEQLVVQQRSPNKQIRPLHYSIVEETVHSEESFEEAAVRGVKEELGLEATELEEFGKIRIKDEKYNDDFLLGVFKANGAGEIIIDKNEVESFKEISLEEAEKLLNSGEKISPGFSKSFPLLKEATK